MPHLALTLPTASPHWLGHHSAHLDHCLRHFPCMATHCQGLILIQGTLALPDQVPEVGHFSLHTFVHVIVTVIHLLQGVACNAFLNLVTYKKAVEDCHSGRLLNICIRDYRTAHNPVLREVARGIPSIGSPLLHQRGWNRTLEMFSICQCTSHDVSFLERKLTSHSCDRLPPS